MLTKKANLEIQNWIYRNARPLDIARWQYHNEKGSKEAVLTALSAYQNEDGGFGHALEPDSWNPYSSPIQTYTATELLKEIGFTDRNHPIMKGILNYLDSEADFNGKLWYGAILSNNDYPHAPWWKASNELMSQTGFNPSAGLVGFALCYSDMNSAFFHKCERIALEAFQEFISKGFSGDMHTGLCYLRLLDYCEQGGITELFDIAIFKQKLMEQVKMSITADKSVWKTSYICKPSQFFKSSDSIFYESNKEVADYECRFIEETLNADGTWDIVWGWSDYPNEWAVAKKWWQGNLAVINMLYLKQVSKDAQ